MQKTTCSEFCRTGALRQGAGINYWFRLLVNDDPSVVAGQNQSRWYCRRTRMIPDRNSRLDLDLPDTPRSFSVARLPGAAAISWLASGGIERGNGGKSFFIDLFHPGTQMFRQTIGVHNPTRLRLRSDPCEQRSKPSCRSGGEGSKLRSIRTENDDRSTHLCGLFLPGGVSSGGQIDSWR